MAWIVESPLANGDSIVSKAEVIIVLSLAILLSPRNITDYIVCRYVVSVAPSFCLKTSLSFLCLHHLLSYLHFWQ
jgi:hypothetical protein